MKKLILLFFLLQLIPQSIQAQSIRILDQYIVPFDPQAGDSVFVQLRTRFSSSYGSFGYQVQQIGDSFSIEQCVFLGPLTVVMTHDTLLFLNVLDTGEYAVNYMVYRSNSTDSCTHENSFDSTVHFQIGLGTGINQNPRIDVKVFPNPSNGLFKLTYDSKITGPMTALVYSIDGQRVYPTSLSLDQEGNGTLDLSDKPKGIYILVMQSGTEIRRTKLVLE